MNGTRGGWRGFSSLMLGLAGGWLGAWLALPGARVRAAEPPAELRVRQLTVVDDAGQPRLELAVDALGARVVLLDAGGARRAVLACESATDGAGLALFDAAGKQRAGFGSDREGGGWHLASATGQAQVDCGLAADGLNGGFAYQGADGHPVFALGTGPPGTGLSFLGPNGQERLGVSMIPNGAAAFVVRAEDGAELWRAP